MAFEQRMKFKSALEKEKENEGRFYFLPAMIVVMLVSLIFMSLGTVLTNNGIPFKLSFLSTPFNGLLFEGSSQRFFGIALLDLFTSGFIRACIFGLVPLFFTVAAVVWVRARDLTNANIFLAFFGVLVGMPFFYLFIMDFFIPFISDAFSLF